MQRTEKNLINREIKRKKKNKWIRVGKMEEEWCKSKRERRGERRNGSLTRSFCTSFVHVSFESPLSADRSKLISQEIEEKS